MKNSFTEKYLLSKTALLLILIFAFLTLSEIRIWFAEKFILKYETEISNIKNNVYFGGIRRSYVVHLPDGYSGEESLPVMLIFHGAGGNADSIRDASGMNVIADSENFIVAYPNGTGLFNEYVLSWNAGECCNYVEPLGVDDVGFVKFLIATLKADYNINSDKIYAAGFSNGGMMVYRLGCEDSELLAGMAIVSSTICFEACMPSEKIPLVVFHGMKDIVIPYNGGVGTDFFTSFFKVVHKPVLDSVSFWAKNNKCEPVPQKEKEDGIYKEVYSDCEKNADVEFYVIEDGGHAWPGTGEGWLLGDKPVVFPASEIIWQFLVDHSSS